MKRNLIVLFGTAVVIVCALFVPAITYTMQNSLGSNQVSAPDSTVIIFAIVILLVMLFSWKWRGIVWIVLSIGGAIWAPVAANALYSASKAVNTALDATSTISEPSYTIGLYLIIVGFVIIVAGGVWDIVQKRKLEGAKPSAT